MCRNCLNRCSCRDNFRDRSCSRHNCYCDNRCDDFLLPMMFWMVRDMTRSCRCSWVNRYDRYRC